MQLSSGRILFVDCSMLFCRYSIFTLCTKYCEMHYQGRYSKKRKEKNLINKNAFSNVVEKSATILSLPILLLEVIDSKEIKI